MNWFEGLRRLGIAAGIIGACIASVFAYPRITDAWQAHKHSHERTIHAAIQDLRMWKTVDEKDDPKAKTPPIPTFEQFKQQEAAAKPGKQSGGVPAGYVLDDPQPATAKPIIKTYVVPDSMTDQEIFRLVEKDDIFFKFERPRSEPLQIVQFPAGMELLDPKAGEIWESRPEQAQAPAGWYALSWPILGFLIPWGTVMGIRWILAGLFPRSVP